jgi:hypothetical protein
LLLVPIQVFHYGKQEHKIIYPRVIMYVNSTIDVQFYNATFK